MMTGRLVPAEGIAGMMDRVGDVQVLDAVHARVTAPPPGSRPVRQVPIGWW